MGKCRLEPVVLEEPFVFGDVKEGRDDTLKDANPHLFSVPGKLPGWFQSPDQHKDAGQESDADNHYRLMFHNLHRSPSFSDLIDRVRQFCSSGVLVQEV
jgi:hypothetical protein